VHARAHWTIAAGVAKMLAPIATTSPGRIAFVFQPAGCAKAVICLAGADGSD